MKAILLKKYGAKHLSFSDAPLPCVSKSHVLIKIKSTAINDYDACMVRGSPFIYRLMFGLFKPKNPIAGMELSGVVEQIGDEVTHFKIGDEVYGDISEHAFGSFAQFISVDQKALRLKPSAMSFEVAASLPHASMLAFQGLVQLGKLKDNQKILINGAGGGVGSIAINLAKQFNVHVTGVDTGDKLKTMTAIGFDEVIDYRQVDFTKLNEQYDIIFDTKTMRSPLKFLNALNHDGHYITVGGHLRKLLQTLIYKPFIQLFSSKRFSILALKANKDLATIENLYAKGVIKPIIDGPYDMQKIPELIDYFSQAKHTGKIIINIEHSHIGDNHK